jgi:hypothetical protein
MKTKERYCGVSPSDDHPLILIDELALHPIFKKEDLPANQHIIRRQADLCPGVLHMADNCRKAALCYIQSQHFPKAQEVLRACPQDQAATQYLNFMSALAQNKDDSGENRTLPSEIQAKIIIACQAIDNICRCPDLKISQLQLIVYV